MRTDCRVRLPGFPPHPAFGHLLSQSFAVGEKDNSVSMALRGFRPSATFSFQSFAVGKKEPRPPHPAFGHLLPQAARGGEGTRGSEQCNLASRLSRLASRLSRLASRVSRLASRVSYPAFAHLLPQSFAVGRRNNSFGRLQV
jgi:hypothetical protein